MATSTITNLDVNVRAVGTDKYTKSIDKSIRDSDRLKQSLTGLDKLGASDPFRNMARSLADLIPGLNQVVDGIRAIGEIVKSTPSVSKLGGVKPITIQTSAEKVAKVAGSGAVGEAAASVIAKGAAAGAAGAGAAGTVVKSAKEVFIPKIDSALELVTEKATAEMGSMSFQAKVLSAHFNGAAFIVADLADNLASLNKSVSAFDAGVNKSSAATAATFSTSSGNLGQKSNYLESQKPTPTGITGPQGAPIQIPNVSVERSANEFQAKIGQASKSFGDRVKDAARSAWKTIDNGATAYYNFVLKSGKAAANFIDRAGAKFDQAVYRMAKAAPGVAKGAVVGGAKALAGATILGVTAAATVGALNVGPAIDRLDQLSDAAAKAGTDINQLRQIRFSLGEGSGAAAEDSDKAVIALQRSLTGAVQGTDAAAQAAFEKLGIDAGEAMAAGPLEAMLRISDGFANIADPGERLQLSMDLMGKSGIAIAAGLSGGRDALADSLDFAERNLKVSEESAALAGQFNDLWDRFKLTLDGVYERFAARLLPSLVSFFDLIGDSADGAGLLSTVLDGVASFLELSADFTYSTFQYLGKAYDIAKALATLDYSAASDAYDREIKSFSDLARSTKERVAGEAEARNKRKADAAALERAAELEEKRTEEIRKQTEALEEQARARDKAGKDAYDDIEAQILAAKRLAEYLKDDPVNGQAAFDRAEASRKFAEQIGDQDPLGDRRAVYEQQLEQRDAAVAEVERQRDKRAVLQQYRTPEQVFLDRLKELENLFKDAPTIELPKYERAVKDARNELDRAQGIDRSAPGTGGSAIEAGSTALYQLLLAGTKSSEDPAIKLSQQQVDAQLNGNTLLTEIRDKIQFGQSLGIIE